MANRSWNCSALVLSLTSFGEGHREACLFTEDNTLVRAAVFGGAKSKLRSLVSPWHRGRVWIYSDPVKKTAKITDFDVQAFHEGIREDLVRTWCASLCTEILTRSHGIADWKLVNAFIDGIAVSSPDDCRRALIRYLWRTLTVAGLNPPVDCCPQCGSGVNSENAVVYYSPHEDACVCLSCVGLDEKRFPLSPEARSYLVSIACLKPTESRAIPLGLQAYTELKNFLFFLLSRMIDSPLKTLESGEGIL